MVRFEMVRTPTLILTEKGLMLLRCYVFPRKQLIIINIIINLMYPRAQWVQVIRALANTML